MAERRPLVVLTVGHTEKAQGAMALPPLSKSEYNFNRELTMDLADRLTARYQIYVAFRDSLGVDKTYEEIAKMKPYINIELHFNSSSDVKAYGTETLCCQPSQKFAAILQHSVCEALKRDSKGDRGVRVLKGPDQRGWHSVSALPNTTNVLIEPFFGSNPNDVELIIRDRDLYIDAIERALDIWSHWDYDGSE